MSMFLLVFESIWATYNCGSLWIKSIDSKTQSI